VEDLIASMINISNLNVILILKNVRKTLLAKVKPHAKKFKIQVTKIVKTR
jgi:hypothetical protein